jgi:hypothetical protein
MCITPLSKIHTHKAYVRWEFIDVAPLGRYIRLNIIERLKSLQNMIYN